MPGLEVGCLPRKLDGSAKHSNAHHQDDHQEQVANQAMTAAKVDVVGDNVHPVLPACLAHDSTLQITIKNPLFEAVARAEADCSIRPDGVGFEEMVLNLAPCTCHQSGCRTGHDLSCCRRNLTMLRPQCHRWIESGSGQ